MVQQFVLTRGSLGDDASLFGAVQDPEAIGEQGTLAGGQDLDLVQGRPNERIPPCRPAGHR